MSVSVSVSVSVCVREREREREERERERGGGGREGGTESGSTTECELSCCICVQGKVFYLSNTRLPARGVYLIRLHFHFVAVTQ